MIRSSFVGLLFTCVICSFCGQDFVTLGRHSWRCKERINHAEQDNPSTTTSQMPVMQSPNVVLSKRTVIKCCCGKICKGTRGLKMHQRSCHLNDELCADIEEQMTTDTSDDIPEECNYDCNMGTVSDENFPELKKG